MKRKRKSILGISFTHSSLRSIMQFTSAFYDFTYKPLKNQKCKWLNPINYCLYCILWLKRASDKYFKYNPAISLCAVTLIRSDWCPVPIFVHLRILFPFLLLLSTVLGFSFIHHCTQVILIPSAFPIVAETVFQYIPNCIASWFFWYLLVSFLSVSRLDTDFYTMLPSLAY